MESLVQTASDTAGKTIQDALGQYSKVQEDVTNLSKSLQEKSEKVSNELSNWEKETISEQLKDYEKFLSQETKATIQDLQSLSKTELKTLSAELAAAVAHTKSEINQVLLANTQAAAAELQRHTEEQKQRVTRQAEAVIDQVVAAYLTTHLTPAEKHSLTLQLVEELLPQAKQEA